MTYSIENNYLKLTTDTHGAEIISVINKQTGKEMMWQGDPSIWDGHSPMLFPYCGKLKDNKYFLDNKEYTSPKHGFIKNYDHQLLSSTKNEIHYIFNSTNETKKMFPRDFSFETIYSIEENILTQRVKVTNKGINELRFGLGFHPAFRIPFDNKHTTKDYELKFDTPQTPIIQENYLSGPYEGLVSGKTTTLIEDNDTIKLDDNMFNSDSICLSKLTAKTISIVEKDTRRKIDVNIEGFPYVLLWSAAGKGSLKFICIEPWLTLQDTADTNGDWAKKPCAAILNPGEIWQKELTIIYNTTILAN